MTQDWQGQQVQHAQWSVLEQDIRNNTVANHMKKHTFNGDHADRNAAEPCTTHNLGKVLR